MFLTKHGKNAISSVHQGKDYPGDITAVMNDTSTANVSLRTGGETTTPVTPVNFAVTAAADTLKEYMQWEKLTNSVTKYQKENSRMKRVNMKMKTEISLKGHALLSLLSSLFFIQLFFRDEKQWQLLYRKWDNNKKLEKEKR